MLRTLLASVLVSASAPLAAAQSGTVNYSMTARVDVVLPPEAEHLRGQLPSSRNEERVLTFSPEASLERGAVPAKDIVQEAGPQMRLRTRRSEHVLYVDVSSGARVEQRGFLSRTFLIRSEVDTPQWQITGEQGEFLGYPVQQAIFQKDTVRVEAWFTPEIPAAVGPNGYGGLPGLILSLVEDDGRRSFVATSVELGPLEDGALQPPTEGQPVTREEYSEIVRERLSEMQQGDGATFIRVN